MMNYSDEMAKNRLDFKLPTNHKYSNHNNITKVIQCSYANAPDVET